MMPLKGQSPHQHANISYALRSGVDKKLLGALGTDPDAMHRSVSDVGDRAEQLVQWFLDTFIRGEVGMHFSKFFSPTT